MHRLITYCQYFYDWMSNLCALPPCLWRIAANNVIYIVLAWLNLWQLVNGVTILKTPHVATLRPLHYKLAEVPTSGLWCVFVRCIFVYSFYSIHLCRRILLCSLGMQCVCLVSCLCYEIYLIFVVVVSSVMSLVTYSLATTHRGILQFLVNW